MTDRDLLKTAITLLSKALAAYHSQIQLGLACDDLWERLKDPLEQARFQFMNEMKSIRHSTQADFIWLKALNDFILADQSHLTSPVW